MRKLSALIHPAVGILLCLGASLGLAYLFAGKPISTALPLAFISVLCLLTWWYGVAVGVVGSLMSALIFAHFMFDPMGSWHVADAAARRNLFWMVLGGISLSYLLAPPGEKPRRP